MAEPAAEPSTLGRDLRRSLLHGVLAGALLVPFGLWGLVAGKTVWPTMLAWFLVGLSLVVPPLITRRRLEHPPAAIPPTGTLALVFATAFAGALFAFFEGAHIAAVGSGASFSQAFAVLGDLAHTLGPPFRPDEWWDTLLPWDRLWTDDRPAPRSPPSSWL